MRRSHLWRARKARAFAVLAAASSFTTARDSLAQNWTWANPISGQWSVPANWLPAGPPASGATTNLFWSASGVQTYTSTNNVAGSFTLNSLNFTNTGTGAINVAGNALQTNGVASINVTGNGAVTIANALNSIAAPTGTTGGVFAQNGGNVSLSGGGNLLALTAVTGNMTMSGGAWTMTSTLRRNDALASDTGPWSLNIGESAGGANFNQTGGTITAGQGFINVGAPGSGVTDTISGTWNMSGASTSAVFGFQDPSTLIGRFGILQGNGSINVTSGARLAGRLFEVGRQSGQDESDAIVNVTGGGLIEAHQMVGRASGRATITVNTGGMIDLTMVDATGSTGAALMVLGVGQDGLQESAPSLGVLNIGAGGTVRAVQPQIGGELGIATINITGGGDYVARPSLSPSTVGEATFLGEADALDVGDLNPLTGTGAINVDGAGSTYNQTTTTPGFGGVIVMGGGGGSTQAGDAHMNVTNGGSVLTNDLTVAQDEGSDSILTMSGATSTIQVLPNNSGSIGSVVVGGNRVGPLQADGTVVLNGGTLSTGNTFFGGGFVDGVGDPIPGGTAHITINNGARLVVTNQFTTSSTLNSVSTINLNTGGVITVGGNSFLSPSEESTASTVMNVSGGTFATTGQLQVAGAGTVNGGPAVLNISNGGYVSASGGTNSLVAVFQNGVINVGVGNSPGTLHVGALGLLVDGQVNLNAGTISSVGTLEIGGTIFLQSAARLPDGTPTNKKTLELGPATLTASGVIDLNDNDMISRDGLSREQVEQFIFNARNFGAWDQPGITSSAAASNGLQNTTLGVLTGAEYLGVVEGGLFNGRPVEPDDVLVKYTFYGDTDFNGFVDGDDYFRIDNGFNTGLSNWFNGDFDLNNVIDGDDYALIDNAFSTQNQILSRVAEILGGPDPDRAIQSVLADNAALAGMGELERRVYKHALEFGESYRQTFLSAIPEPAAITLAGAVLIGATLPRRHRRSAPF
jgi:hypothetical protein